MNSLLTLENTPRPIEEGDAGVVLTKNGKFFVFNTHDNFDPSNMTERQIEQGKMIQALSVALQIPQIMDVLLQMASDPNIVGDTILDMGRAN